MAPSPAAPAAGRRSVRVGALIGIGVMAAVDEIVFHQLLAWHHFYDRSTSTAALASDGLLHAAELVLLMAGIFGVADLQRRGMLHPRAAWGGALLGAGGFQLFDGIVDHKLLRVHQIRYDVDLLPYDLAWNGAGLLIVALGVLVLVRARRDERPLDPARTGDGRGSP